MRERKDKNVSLHVSLPGNEMEFSSFPRKYEELGPKCAPKKCNYLLRSFCFEFEGKIQDCF